MMKSISITLLFLFCIVISLSKDYSGSFETLYPENSLLNAGSLYPLGEKLPTSRVHHSLALSSNYVILFGGYSTDGTYLDDINLFDVRTQQWSGPILKKACCDDQIPYQTKEVLGMDTPSPFSKMIKTGWQGDLPLARAEHQSVVIETTDLMYMFGGVTKEYGYMNDLYYFSPKLLDWTKQNYNSGQVPKSRAGHALSLIHISEPTRPY